MVNVTYDASGSLVASYDPASDPVVYNPGDISFMVLSSALVMIMVPGIGFLYSGLLRRKNATSMLLFMMAIYSVATVHWFFWGYSLAFSVSGAAHSKGFIGNLAHFGLINVLDAPSPGSDKIPELVFCYFQGMFAALTPVIAMGGCAERARVAPMMIFMICWLTLVYDIIACWTWNPNGWAFSRGVIDFAGGGPVHMSSGTCALALSIFLGPRRGYESGSLAYRPHSVSHVVLGTIFLYFGWFGFNGGSAFSANLRTAQACIATNVAAAAGGLTWMLMDYVFSRRWSAVSICTGVVVGLVGITPGAGFVGTPSALAIGVVTAFFANLATSVKRFLHYDEPLDVFATHAVGGWVGSFLTGLFADSRVSSFDGSTVGEGWINRHFVQLGWQIANSMAVVGWTFLITLGLLFVINFIPGLHFRIAEEGEILGIDEEQLGEASYDYAYVTRDIDNPNEHARWLSEHHSRSDKEKHEESVTTAVASDQEEISAQ